MENGDRLFVTWIDTNKQRQLKFKEDFVRYAASLEQHDNVEEFSYENHIGYIKPHKQGLRITYKIRFPVLGK